MTWRRAWTYFGMFVILAAYYAASEPRSAELPGLPERHAFLPMASADVQAVTVEREAVRIRCVRDGTRWRVVSPADTSAPSDLIAALVDQLTQLPDVEVVDERGERAAQFGLDPPAVRVSLSTAAGRTIVVALGVRNPAQTAVYGRVEGAPRIVVLGLNVLYYQDLIVQAVGGKG